jgi:hypothetical protein
VQGIRPDHIQQSETSGGSEIVVVFRSRVGRAAKLLTVDLRGKQGTSGAKAGTWPGGGNDRNIGLEVDRHRRGGDGRA